MALNQRPSGKTRCAIYLRVSSDEQATGHAGKKAGAVTDEKYGIPRQKEDCYAYAAERGWEVTHVYVEVYTGTKLWERPELTRMREAMARREFDVILVHELSRLSRNTNHQGLIFSEAERYKIAWDSATEDIDNSPQGKMLRSIIGAYAEIERDRLIMRTRGGHHQRIQSGKLPPMPFPKFGLLWDDPKTKGKFVPNPETVGEVAWMYAQALAGKTDWEIAHDLERRGVPSPRGDRKWWQGTIARILTDPTYKGETYANTWETFQDDTGAKQKRKRPQDEWLLIPDAAPVVIDPATWERVQEARARRKRTATRNNKHPESGLLRGGHLICPACGWIYHVANKPQREGGPTYVHSSEAARIHKCRMPAITTRILDPQVWAAIEQRLRDPDLIAREIEGYRATDPTIGKIELVEAEIAKLQRQHAKATERALLFAGDDDDPTYQAAQAVLTRLADGVRANQQELERLQEMRRSWEVAQDAFVELTDVLRRLDEKLDDLTPDLKRRAVRALDVKIYLHPKGAPRRWEGTMRLSPTALEPIAIGPSPAKIVPPTTCASSNYIHAIILPIYG